MEKRALNPRLRDLVDRIEESGRTAPSLAYVVYSLLLAFTTYPGTSFTTRATIVGAVQAALDEFKRVDEAEFEREKALSNGAADDFVRMGKWFAYEGGDEE